MKIEGAPTKPATFRRFTTWRIAEKILTEGKLELRHPEYWDDREDMSLFSEKWSGSEFKKIKVLCVNWDHERIQNWKNYSDDMNIVCLFISPNNIKLKDENLICEKIIYFNKLSDYKSKRNELKQIYPDNLFIKRAAYKLENEFRFITKSKNNYIELGKSSIHKVLFSPFFDEEQYNKNKDTLIKMRTNGVLWLRGTKFEKSSILEEVSD